MSLTEIFLDADDGKFKCPVSGKPILSDGIDAAFVPSKATTFIWSIEAQEFEFVAKSLVRYAEAADQFMSLMSDAEFNEEDDEDSMGLFSDLDVSALDVFLMLIRKSPKAGKGTTVYYVSVPGGGVNTATVIVIGIKGAKKAKL